MVETSGLNNGNGRFHRLKSLSVIGGFLDGMHIEFADGLNCLIGHRGTGKTTLLEFVRYALDDFPWGEAGQLCRKRVETLVKSNLGDGRIRLALETKDGLEYIVDRTASGDSLVLTADAQPTDVRINAAGIFSADIFSQNEIENIADSPQAQLELIDKFAATQITEINRRIAALRSNLEANAKTIIANRQQLDGLSDEVGTLSLVEAKINTLAEAQGDQRTDEVNLAHHHRGLRGREERAVKEARELIQQYVEWLRDSIGQFIDWSLLGFDPDELAQLLDPGVQQGLTDPDDIPEPPDEAITQRGDLWILGNHRLLCGDSSSVEDLDRLLDGVTVDLFSSDPPYNVRVEPRSNNAIAAGLSSFGDKSGVKALDAKGLHHSGFDVARGKSGNTHHQKLDVARHPEKSQATHRKLRPKDRPLANDFVSADSFDEMLLAWFSNASRVLKPGGSFYIWAGYANLGNYPAPLKAAGLYFSQAIVWDKLHPVLTRKDMMGAFELAFYGWKEGAGHNFYGPNNATDLWHVKKVNPQAMVHLTEKPVELAVRSIQYSSLTGQNVLDLFGGSGSTLIGCQQTGRRAFLMELDPLYCDVIVKRWEQFTGQKAERVAQPAVAEAVA